MRTVQETQAGDSGLVVVRSLVQRYGHGERREPDATERVAARVARYHQRRDRSDLDLRRVRRLDSLSDPLRDGVDRGPDHVAVLDAAAARIRTVVEQRQGGEVAPEQRVSNDVRSPIGVGRAGHRPNANLVGIGLQG